jgi:hypothetical protein
MNEEKLTREEALGNLAQQCAASVSRASLWSNAHELVNRLPSAPDEITRRDSNSETEKWQRLAHESQAPPWSQRGK